MYMIDLHSFSLVFWAVYLWLFPVWFSCCFYVLGTLVVGWMFICALCAFVGVYVVAWLAVGLLVCCLCLVVVNVVSGRFGALIAAFLVCLGVLFEFCGGVGRCGCCYYGY